MPAALKSRCPHCQAVAKVTDSLLGKLVRCPACKQSFEVSSVEARLTPSDSLDRAPAARETMAVSSADNPSLLEGRPSKNAMLLSKLGRFELRELLGEGAFGCVYLAHDPQHDRKIALKIAKFGAADKRKIERFTAEAKAAGKLEHPNIVPIYESGQCEGKYYIASQFISGQTLSARIKENPPDFRQAAEWVRQLAEALSYAHSEQIIHRDIKPDNIMFDGKGALKITDFGLAKRLHADSAMSIEGLPLGTPAYMSPEQASGRQKEICAATDQYSLGIILYELLTGRKPFEGDDAYEVMEQIRSGELSPPQTCCPAIPHELNSICLKALSKRVEDRYSSCQEFAADLGRWLAGEFIKPPEPPPIVIQRRPRPAGSAWSVRQSSHIRKTLTICSLILAVLTLTLLAASPWISSDLWKPETARVAPAASNGFTESPSTKPANTSTTERSEPASPLISTAPQKASDAAPPPPAVDSPASEADSSETKPVELAPANAKTNPSSPANPAPQSRTHWVHSQGNFRLLEPGIWEETMPNGGRIRFKEVVRNEEFIEIEASNGITIVTIRLYNVHCDLGYQPDPVFGKVYTGSWVGETTDAHTPALSDKPLAEVAKAEAKSTETPSFQKSAIPSKNRPASTIGRTANLAATARVTSNVPATSNVENLNPLQALIDGEPLTEWRTEYDSLPAIITLNWDKPVTTARQLTIRHGCNDTNWNQEAIIQLREKSGRVLWSAPVIWAHDKLQFEIEVPRDIRSFSVLTVEIQKKAPNPRLAEIEVHAELFPHRNIAYDAVVTCTRSHDGRTPLDDLKDGNIDTKIHLEESLLPGTISFKWAKPVKAESIVLRSWMLAIDNPIKNGKLELVDSRGKTVWQTEIREFHNRERRELSPNAAAVFSELRFTVIEGGSPFGPCLAEIEVYGSYANNRRVP